MDEFVRAEYPLASKYAADWVLERDMGPHPLWLLEDLARDLDLRPEMRVLDLGSGKGATSVFLAREYGVQVYAADLWIDPTEAAVSFDGLDIVALKAEAHALPFAREFFDAIVCIDAYEYFGTADGYLPYLLGFLKPGGQVGVATPAMRTEIRELGKIPDHIQKVVGWEAIAWHTADWWRFQWEITGLVDDVLARFQETGWQDWLLWSKAVAARQRGDTPDQEVTMLEEDRGELLTFTLLSARKRP